MSFEKVLLVGNSPSLDQETLTNHLISPDYDSVWTLNSRFRQYSELTFNCKRVNHLFYDPLFICNELKLIYDFICEYSHISVWLPDWTVSLNIFGSCHNTCFYSVSILSNLVPLLTSPTCALLTSCLSDSKKYITILGCRHDYHQSSKSSRLITSKMAKKNYPDSIPLSESCLWNAPQPEMQAFSLHSAVALLEAHGHLVDIQ